MAKQKNLLLAFNRGLISRFALSRVDLSRTALSAQEMTNWMPRVMGSMSLRPGLEYTGATYNHDRSRSIPFVFSIEDTARLEFTGGSLRVWDDDELVTRPTVTAAVTNGTFTTDVSGWTDSDEVGATSAWKTGGYLSLLGDGENAAIRDQQVTVNQAGTRHALRVVVQRGPVLIKVGSSLGTDEYIEELTLDTGTYSLAFTPSGNFYIRLFSRRGYEVLIDSVTVESNADMVLPSPYQEEDLSFIRAVQSGDTMYLACVSDDNTYQQRIVRRYDEDSWGICTYETEDGPFRIINNTPITLAPSALSGTATLTASQNLFTSDHIGALFRIESEGQTVTKAISAQNTFSDPIRVAGVEGARIFSIIIAGTFSATVTLQYSVAEPGNWVDIATTYTGVVSTSYDDGLDNQIIYYRIGVKTGGYVSGTANVTLAYSSGSIVGICKVYEYVSRTQVNVSILRDMGALTASADWWEGRWSAQRGFPSAVALHEGRLWWMGNDKIDGSVSDDYYSFDDELEGDAGPISRSIGEGPIDTINWGLSLGRLIIGTHSLAASISPIRLENNSVLSARSSSFDEPLTPSNFNLKYENTTGVFVDQSKTRLMSVGYNIQAGDYLVNDMTLLVPDIAGDGIVALAAQKNPDPRVYAVLEDGTVAVQVFDKLENVNCFVKIETEGTIEDVCVLPRLGEDAVYLTILRSIGGVERRYHERLAMIADCAGGTLNKQADSFYEYSGVSDTDISGLDHLEGCDVVVWGNGKFLGTYTVDGGVVSDLSEAVTSAIVGLSYEARFKSTKQSIATEAGIPLNEEKRIDSIGLVMVDTHKNGIEYGPDFDNLEPLPDVEEGTEVAADYVWEEYDQTAVTFNGVWTTNAVVCLKATAPKPCTVLSVAVSITT